MRSKITAILFSGLLWGVLEAKADPLGTAISYQAQFNDKGSPANGQYSFRFRLLADPAGLNQVGPTVDLPNKTISGGMLNTSLDFGPSAFADAARWLEIAVKAGS